jgi:hypothetical protein
VAWPDRAVRPKGGANGAGGLTILDVAGLVVGAAVASVHLRGPGGIELMQGLGALFWMTFAGVALTAAGPVFYLNRRVLRPALEYPKRGDRLWLALGIPWLMTAPLRIGPWSVALREGFYAPALAIAQAVACMYVLATVWVTWRRAAIFPEETVRPGSWTDRMGMALAVAWPLQCGFVLVVLST